MAKSNEKVFGKPKWLKAGLFGFPKRGKTYTAINIACGLAKGIGLKRPIQVYDSEGGFEYQATRVKELTGIEPDGILSQNFVDLIAFTKRCQEGDIVIVDSVTHPWRELLDAKQKSDLGRFRGIMSAIEEWANKFSAWYLSSPCHVLICGRAGFIFAEEQDDEGKMKLVTKGTKMKTHSELGFEPSLLIEMERDEQSDKTLRRVAIVKGDRFGIIDGKRFVDPVFEDFKEFFSRMDLTTGGAPALDTKPKTAATLRSGKSDRQQEREEREIILDEIKGDLVSAFPGQSAPEKKSKVDMLKLAFGTPSWVRLEKEAKVFPADRLREGRIRIHDRIEEMKQEAEAIA